MEIKRFFTQDCLKGYVEWLYKEEKSAATIAKYQHDVMQFWDFLGKATVQKEDVIRYKEWLIKHNYTPRSVNSMLAAVNSLFVYLGWEECKVKSMRLQRQVYCPESKELSKEEYLKLVRAAQSKGDERLGLLLQTLCSTGMRISELSSVTVEAVRAGETMVHCKGKSRRIFLVPALQDHLCQYIRENRIETGPVFISNRGNPMNRSNIWREMKSLCAYAGVEPKKVTPHNLRHLFARSFYAVDKDIAKLADVLGHSSIDTTRIYVMTTEKEHVECMEKLQLTL